MTIFTKADGNRETCKTLSTYVVLFSGCILRFVRYVFLLPMPTPSSQALLVAFENIQIHMCTCLLSAEHSLANAITRKCKLTHKCTHSQMQTHSLKQCNHVDALSMSCAAIHRSTNSGLCFVMSTWSTSGCNKKEGGGGAIGCRGLDHGPGCGNW